MEKKQRAELKQLKRENLSSFAIKGTDEEWGKALSKNKTSIISVKRLVLILFTINSIFFNPNLHHSGEQKLGEAKGWDDVPEPHAKKKKFNNSDAGQSNKKGKSGFGKKINKSR